MQEPTAMESDNRQEGNIDDHEASVLSAFDEQTREDVSSINDQSSEDSPCPSSGIRGLDTKVAREETKLILCSKGLVLVVLIVAATLCAMATYTITKNGEIADFESQVAAYGTEIIELSGIATRNTFVSVEGFSLEATSYALDRGLSWPFVTLPHWYTRAEYLLNNSVTDFIGMCPIVREHQREQWGEYSYENRGWMRPLDKVYGNPDNIKPYIFRIQDIAKNIPIPKTDGVLFPGWQIVPMSTNFVNHDILHSLGNARAAFQSMIKTRSSTLSAPLGSIVLSDNVTPTSLVVTPIFQDIDQTGEIVGAFLTVFKWSEPFTSILREDGASMFVVIANSCSQSMTMRLDANSVTFIGYGRHHDSRYDNLGQKARFNVPNTYQKEENRGEDCPHYIEVFPTYDFYERSRTAKPLIYTFIVIGIFVITSVVFVLHDLLMARRQHRVESSAMRSNAIVNAIFPEQVRGRLIDAQSDGALISGERRLFGRNDGQTGGGAPEDILSTDPNPIGNERLLSSKPIADLFPNASVMFADIAGFTAWSSVREPTQVFTLLEQVYSSFDAIAKVRKIFKVETIGDCYVAAAGLPEARDDHAPALARFANECRIKFRAVVKKLEVILGPDTCELSMRFGIHSGPVTAGVLRGEKSRFQLFGDTVNTAARVESTGERNRIHLSKETAALIIANGKEDWVTPREMLVSAKGKGMMKTFWLNTSRSRRKIKKENDTTEDTASIVDNTGDSATLLENCNFLTVDERTARLIGWNVDVLSRQLKKIVAMRLRTPKPTIKKKARLKPGLKPKTLKGNPIALRYVSPEGMNTVLDEVKEVIPLMNQACNYKQDPGGIVLSEEVEAQLHEFVTKMATLYADNKFHSFEHASHVVQSVSKLLSRIVAPDDIGDDWQYKRKTDGCDLHDHTYGITSDPLIHFACAFSALIHDVEHCGLPNAQLIKEGCELAKKYHNQSVAEQNSVDVAWTELMKEDYGDLRACIYQTQEELQRFRSLVVNSVMATDIADKELGALRKARWAKAFEGSEHSSSSGGPLSGNLESGPLAWRHNAMPNAESQQAAESEEEKVNRKATIVIEHLIQASDVSHTMQHWHVYRKWNERLFHEMYKAYKCGKADADPSISWYNGELGFFDHYIVPLAKKLKDCGVFGVSSDEYLNYAIANRLEWHMKGRAIVSEYLERCEEEYASIEREESSRNDLCESSSHDDDETVFA